MIRAVFDRVDRLLGRGRHSTVVPVMDGPLQPNRLLDEADVLLTADGLDNLAATPDGRLRFSTGARLMRLDPGAAEPVEEAIFAAEITCLAASPGGALAVGCEGGGILLRGGAHDGRRIDSLGSDQLLCPTAAVFRDEDRLIVAAGARDLPPSEWKRDLMRHGRTGAVWEVNLASSQTQRLADGLAWPCGVTLAGGDVLVSEAWAHRVLRLAGKGAQPMLADLPGYPSRIVARQDGGYLLCLFAPRNQLVEFVLRETEYRNAMTAQVAPEFWIAPSLGSGRSFKEPLQGGAVKTMGILKPWAPSWSYGLLVVLDADGQPVASLHSRTDGARHGVTSACECRGGILVGIKGAGLAVLSRTGQAGDA